LDALETCLDEGWGEGQDHGLFAARDTAWGIWNEVVELGGATLARLRPGEVTAERLKRVALSRRISLGAQSALDKNLIALGHPEVVLEHLEDSRCTTKLHRLQLGCFLRLEEQSDLTRRMKRYEPEPA
jgi:hypothetical protein